MHRDAATGRYVAPGLPTDRGAENPGSSPTAAATAAAEMIQSELRQRFHDKGRSFSELRAFLRSWLHLQDASYSHNEP